MSVDESNPLYDACVGFMVAEKSEADSWAKVARFVQTKVENGHGDDALLKAEFVVVEKQIKQDFMVTTLPTAWRTAKSTALAAAHAEVCLLDASGNVKGKSSVEDEVRAKKGDVGLTGADKLVMCLRSAIKQLDGARFNDAELLSIDPLLHDLVTARGTVINA